MIRLPSNKVAITPIFDPDKSAGGIWIPEEAKDRCDQGVVKYIGSEVKDLRIGDQVLFGGYDGITIRLEDEGVLIILREQQVRCIIESPDTDIPGLYFKARQSIAEQAQFISDLHNIVYKLVVGQSTTDDVVKELTFLIATNDPYFTATHEMAIHIISGSLPHIKHENKYLDREEAVEVEDAS